LIVDTITSKNDNDDNDDDDDDDNDNMGCIWQVDPSGQMWKCQVAIVGKGARQAQGQLVEQIRNLLHNKTTLGTTTTNTTVDDSNTNNNDHNNSTLLMSSDDKNDQAEEDVMLSDKVMLSFLKKLSLQQATELALECILQSTILQKGGSYKKDLGESTTPKLPPLDTLMSSMVSSSSSSAVLSCIMLDGLPCHVLFLPVISKKLKGAS
jgi:hypothetical protein